MQPGNETHDQISTSVEAQYDVGRVVTIGPGGGTAGSTWIVETTRGRFLLRRRGTRTSDDATVTIDHALRRHLVARGVPSATAVETKRGRTWLRSGDVAYDLYPFVEGDPFDPQDRRHLASSARALARLHEASRYFEPPIEDRRELRQYVNAGIITETSRRLSDPRLIRMQVERLAGRWGPELRPILSWARRIDETYGASVYAELPHLYNHGDYHPANFLFDASGEIVGIFDLDWTFYGSRLFDIAMLLQYVASRKIALTGASDIWSLTEAIPLDV